MNIKRYALLTSFILLTLTACAEATPPPATPTLAPTHTPTLTPTPIPTPTATPIPPQLLTLHWPTQVAAVPPVPIAVDLVPPPGVTAPTTINADVIAPDGSTYAHFALTPRGATRYAADTPLQLPLDPLPGYWWYLLRIQSPLPIRGEQSRYFQPVPIPMRELSTTLPAAITMRVPVAFTETAATGDLWAGARTWRYGKGEVSVWWVPGPTEPLLLNTAIVALEATHDTSRLPQILATEEIQWQTHIAFHFQETWPGAMTGGPAEAWVIQGKNHWLYIVRARALGADKIPPLLQEVAATFSFVEEP